MKKLLLLSLGLNLLGAPAVIKTVCASGCDYSTIQAGVNAAATYQTGTECVQYFLRIKAGETFTEDLSLPAKDPATCSEYVFLDSTELSQLPAKTRVGANSTYKWKLQNATAGEPPVVTATNVKTGYWAFRGAEIQPNSDTSKRGIYYLFRLGVEFTTKANQPHHFLIERSYIHGFEWSNGPRNCLGLNVAYATVRDNHIDECVTSITTGIGGESHAILIVSGNNILIKNNYMHTGSIGSLIGGAASDIKGFISHDIVFEGNYVPQKIKYWHRSGTTPPAAGGACLTGQFYQNNSDANDSRLCVANLWEVSSTTRDQVAAGPKNCWEVKNGVRIVAQGQVCQDWWLDYSNEQQRASVILLNQVDGVNDVAYWSQIRDIEYSYGKADRMGAFFTMGYIEGSTGYFEGTRKINIHNNLTTRSMNKLLWLGRDLTYSDDGTMIGNISAAKSGPADIVFAHNTFTADDVEQVPTNYAGVAAHQFYDTSDPPKNYVHHSNVMDFFGRGPTNESAQTIFCVFGYNLNTLLNASVVFSHDLWVRSYPSGISLTNDDAQTYENGCNLGGYKWRTPASGLNLSAWLGYTANSDVFTDPANGDWTVKASVVAATNGLDSAPIGVDATTVDQATAGTVAGTPNKWFDFKIRSVRPTADGAVIDIVRPTASTSCTATVSTNRGFASDLGSDSWSHSGRRSVLTITGLTAGTAYETRIVCDTYRKETGRWITLP